MVTEACGYEPMRNRQAHRLARPCSAPDLPVTTAHHKAITEHRALARVPTRGSHAFAKGQPDRRHGTWATARSYRAS